MSVCFHCLATECNATQLVKVQDIEQCAARGDHNAQYVLGQLYYIGKEVPKNYRLYFDWTSKAADQGDRQAQAALGFAYTNGWGTPKSPVLAYMWWSLSILNNEEPVVRNNLDMLEQQLSPAELSRAQNLSTEWARKHR